jgi:hypothetical protein
MRPAVLLLLALSGCGFMDARTARDPLKSKVIGMMFPDLADCMGPWDSAHQTKPDEAIVTWKHVDSSAGLKATITLIGSLAIGGGGGCMANFDVNRDGTVLDVTFPGSYSNGVFSTPYSACESLIHECNAYPGNTGVPKGYDAWTYLLPDAKAKP